ncbi:importin subunit beta-3 [Blastocladiella emersonii ATCC 22665]|nr:importin subunit beta-3 [Blastocladiella emersonii ATCC 22665]
MDAAAAEITQLLHALVSNDNTQRADAEATLRAKFIDAQPDLGLPALTQVLRQHPDAPIRAFAAVLFRRLSLSPIIQTAADGTKTHTAPIFLVQEATRVHCLGEVLAALGVEPVPNVRKKLGDCISELAKSLRNKAVAWPEVMPAVFQCVQAAEPEFRESAFQILANVPGLLMTDGAVVDMPSVARVFDASLSDQELMPVRVAALNAAVYFLLEVGEDGKGAFANLMVAMLNVLPALLAVDNEEDLLKAMTSLIELAMGLPKLFRPILPQLVAFVLSLATNPELDPDTRHAALELLLTLVDEAPAMVRKQTPDFCQAVVPVALDMMAQLDDEPAWHTTDSVEDEDDADEAYVIGEQAMDRIARKLGAPTVTPVAFQLIPQMLQAAEWQRRHAALMAVSAIGEGCYKIMNKDLSKVVGMVVPYLADPHPRVRYAACNCIGQLATDFAPQLQKRHFGTIIPALMACMDDGANPRVQAHAAAAMVNFCEEVNRADLQKFLDPLFAKLVVLSSSPKIYVKEQAMTTMATVADAAEDAFATYYPAVMPALMQILQLPNQKELRLLRGKAMECATLIAMAVKEETFAPDAAAFMQALANIQGEVTEADDPQVSYLMHSWARLCTVLKDQFIPYLPVVIPPLVAAAQLKPEVALLDHEENPDEYAAEDGWQHAVIEGQRLCIRTSLLDEKFSAIEMLMCYARNLGHGFRDYAVQVMELLVPQLEFYYHDGVRQVAAAAIAKVIASNPESPEMRAQWSAALARFVKVLPEEEDPEFSQQALSTIAEVIITLRENALTEQEAVQLVQVLGEVADVVYQLVLERDAKRQDEDYDPEQEEALEEDAAMENAVMTSLAVAIQALVKVYGAKILPLLETLLPTIHKALSANDEDLLLLGMSVFDDLIEFAGPAAAKYLPMIGERYLQALTMPQPSVRQSAAYGVGIAAKVGGAEFAQLTLAALPQLAAMLRDPAARDEDNVLASENAVSALAHVLRSPAADAFPQKDEYLALWVQAMPIIYDDDEASEATKFLVHLIDAQHPVVGAQIERVIDALLELLYQGTHDEEPAVAEMVLNRARALLAVLPADRQTALWNALDADKRVELKKYF